MKRKHKTTWKYKLKQKFCWPHGGKVNAPGDRPNRCRQAAQSGSSKINVKKTSAKRRKPAFTLIRTDTTLDLSQKAEKVWIAVQTTFTTIPCSYVHVRKGIYWSHFIYLNSLLHPSLRNKFLVPCIVNSLPRIICNLTAPLRIGWFRVDNRAFSTNAKQKGL